MRIGMLRGGFWGPRVFRDMMVFGSGFYLVVVW